MTENRSSQADTSSVELLWLGRVLLALLLVAVSALAVVYTSFTHRQMFIELQQLETWQRTAQVEIGKLLIEESTWSSPAVVEQMAREQLAMQAPAKEQWVLFSESGSAN